MARKTGRPRNDKSFVDVLLAAPWHVSVVVGVVVFIGLKWILPALAGSNMFLKPISAAASSVAWLFCGVFLLMGAAVFAKSRIAKERLSAATPTIQGVSPDRKISSDPCTVKKESAIPLSTADRNVLEQVWGPRDSEASRPATKPSEWSLDLIRDLEWKRFEDVCQQFYEKKGIRSETTALGPDGGIDIRLYQDDTGLPTSIVQCKAWGERYVGVKPVRELLGVMTHEKISKAFFMTSGSYSDEAKVVAQANRITLIDGNMLLMMIQRLPTKERESLLAFATAGDYSTPTCPTCGVKMNGILGNAERPDFWGCRNYPRCRQKLGMRKTRIV